MPQNKTKQKNKPKSLNFKSFLSLNFLKDFSKFQQNIPLVLTQYKISPKITSPPTSLPLHISQPDKVFKKYKFMSLFSRSYSILLNGISAMLHCIGFVNITSINLYELIILSLLWPLQNVFALYSFTWLKVKRCLTYFWE